MTFQLHSSAFSDGDPIPARFTCEGKNVSPPLKWDGVPDDVKGFALVCSDPDAPAGTWYHWAVDTIPADARALPEGFSPIPAQKGMHQSNNDFKRPGYGGPCPPPGDGVHHYRFVLMALDVPLLDLEDEVTCRQVEQLASNHAIAQATLTGTYSR